MKGLGRVGAIGIRVLPIVSLACVTYAGHVDLVNTEIGTISHLLEPAFQTIQRPNAMLRLVPFNKDFTVDRIGELYLQVVGHRDPMVFPFHPYSGGSDGALATWVGTYDQTDAKPYQYSVFLDSIGVKLTVAPCEKSAIAEVSFESVADVHALVFGVRDGERGGLDVDGPSFCGVDVFRDAGGCTAKVYLYGEFDQVPVRVLGDAKRKAFVFGGEPETVKFRYAVSYISVQQARSNLKSEVRNWNVGAVSEDGKAAWDRVLGRIDVEGGDDNQRTVFYSSLWRSYERMVNITEQGRYYGWDGQAHDANGRCYYTDDWTWDTYRAAHPLMVLLDPKEEGDKLLSYIRMSQQDPSGWMPTFPSVAGDRHSMVNHHAAILFLDAWRKGVRNFDLMAAFKALERTERTESLIPWYRGPVTELDGFYREHGYYPALREGEMETCKHVDTRWEKRQTVSVTQGASYDAWAISEIAKVLGLEDAAQEYAKRSLNYRNLWNAKTQFFHPKDSAGKFIDPFDYMLGGGYGSRDYYTENNGWTYVWDVQHDLAGLVELFGGKAAMSVKLDEMFNTSVGCRFAFAGRMPDSATGLMGVFTMANEPSFHIPYLYDFTDEPWKTQKLVRKTLDAWFRNDKMGLCGDEDGGGMSAYAVFSMMGFYPVQPGRPEYRMGSPVFTKVTIHLQNGKDFVLEAPKASSQNKYIASMKVNGRDWNSTILPHEVLSEGGHVVVEMSPRPLKTWGVEK